MGLKKYYHDVVSTANNAFLAFGAMYLCEISFSAVTTAIKTKYQNKLNIEPDL